MATTHQPLLETPNRKTSPWKSLFLLLSLAAIIGSICIATTKLIANTTTASFNPFSPENICQNAHDKASCLAMVSEVAFERSTKTTHMDSLQMFLRISVSEIRKIKEAASDASHRINNPEAQAALADCLELMDSSVDRIVDSRFALGNQTRGSYSDAHSWLSSVLTNHFTCMDGLNGSAKSMMEPGLQNLIARARGALAMVVAGTSSPDQLRPLNRRFPAWVTARDRWLMEALPRDVVANVVVANDGSGKYKTVKEAVASAPNKGKTRYVMIVIYVKKGTYNENVEIGTAKTNVMLVGDGMDSTIITGSLNVVDGSTTFKSATVAAVGDGFIAQDIWFQNTAGPQKHQAVALRVGADQSVINRCRIDAYQDTLYAHSNRQFYRDCYITGTVDFIFGNAAVVFQNCKIVARQPISGQFNTVTAQGREDPNQNTGTSIQKCDVIASSDLAQVQGSIKSYLGRPWKQYSVTVFMQSYIGDHIDPTGWSPWSGDFALKTLYYGEYMNNGPGAGTSKRVNWPGYHVITSAAEATKFTVSALIQGGSWLKATGVAYTEGL